jgi:hypothetical protein
MFSRPGKTDAKRRMTNCSSSELPSWAGCCTRKIGISNRWRAANRPFSGVVYSQHRRLSIGQIIADLEVVAKGSDPEDWLSRTEYLPL